MEKATSTQAVNRIVDLLELKKAGHTITIHTEFEILPVDFSHRANPFQAYVFLCRFTGTVDGTDFFFRKCYARGCSHNLCPHVSQAVMIANRYLQRDYRRFDDGGIEIEKKVFTLEEMTVKFDGYQEKHSPILAIHDYVNIAKEGNEARIEVKLESVPAVEHFEHEKNRQTFFLADFIVTVLGRVGHHESCLGCYATEKESQERQPMANIANERLKLFYDKFDDAGMIYEKRYFE